MYFFSINSQRCAQFRGKPGQLFHLVEAFYFGVKACFSEESTHKTVLRRYTSELNLSRYVYIYTCLCACILEFSYRAGNV